MKRILFILSAILLASVLFHSCDIEEEFNENLLIGKWKSGTLYYKYFDDHTGYTWDTSDDVNEDEAQPFEWTLVKTELQQIHLMVSGGKVPKYYTVVELTTTTLRYKDSFGKRFSFTKD